MKLVFTILRRSAGAVGRSGSTAAHLGVGLCCLLLFICSPEVSAQRAVAGTVVALDGQPLESVTVRVVGRGSGTLSDAAGRFTLSVPDTGAVELHFSRLNYRPYSETIDSGGTDVLVVLEARGEDLDPVVVSGTLKALSRSESPVPVEVYTARYFAANPAPNFFESLQQVNGVRPQLNCNVCNTGDIHINGLEGPYTMVTIDGMPIVSGLGTVYGLSGIPQALIEQVEVVKGPASTLYGSEAVAGLINVITRSPGDGPRLTLDGMTTSWGETTLDGGLNGRVGERLRGLLGVHLFTYGNPRDDNGDGFTDVTLQDRVSVFGKLAADRPNDRPLTLAGRYLYEERWGGQLDYAPRHRGGDEVYGEYIATHRWETFGHYALPLPTRVDLRYSLTGHYHDSAYGTVRYVGTQYIGFAQLTAALTPGADHDLLLGAAYRYTHYDDNTPATFGEVRNAPAVISLPGVFAQHTWRLSRSATLLSGLRLDYNTRHGTILTPRVNYKLASRDATRTLRISLGNGYRVANVFTEDHAALTGARRTVFAEELRPETSWNANLNVVQRIVDWSAGILSFDGSVWYTRFGNRILPDYESNPNEIIYANLDGHAVSRGGSLNVGLNLTAGTTANVGVTVQDVYTVSGGQRERQLLTEGASAVWRVSQPLGRHWSADYTGNLIGPMRLPLLGPLDDRPATSPWFSLQNLQVTRRWGKRVETYLGVKNLLDYTPPANAIARPFDPFDREVTFDGAGQPVATPDNPRALTFDPTYVFAPNQGRRYFLGLRYALR